MPATMMPGTSEEVADEPREDEQGRGHGSVVAHASAGASPSDPTVLHVSGWPVSTLKAPARTRNPEPARNPPATG